MHAGVDQNQDDADRQEPDVGSRLSDDLRLGDGFPAGASRSPPKPAGGTTLRRSPQANQELDRRAGATDEQHKVDRPEGIGDIAFHPCVFALLPGTPEQRPAGVEQDEEHAGADQAIGRLP